MTDVVSLNDWDLALQRCADEQVQLIGQIQADCVLLAIDIAADRFTYLSENTGELFPGQPDFSPETNPSAVIGARQLEMLAKRAQTWNGRGARLVDIALGYATHAAWIHFSGRNFVIEIDVRNLDHSQTPAAWDWEDLLHDSLNRVEKCPDLPGKFDAVADDTARLGLFDRVTIYQFLEDGTGEVVAEKVRSDWEPYLGLRYPSSDIPAQARELFLKNDIRLIREVTAAPVAILSLAAAENRPLDLSLSRFRQPSPIHLEYLKNMGVVSSFVSAIVSDGKLWGLISCHHGQPLDLPAPRQVQLAALTNHLAADLAGVAREVRLRNEIACARITSKLIQCITVTDDWTSVLISMAGELCEILRSDGLALQFNGQFYSFGLGSTPEILNRLIDDCLNNGSRLSAIVRNASESRFDWLADDIGGALVIPLSHFREDGLVFFRQESTRSVHWAGDPAKVIDRSDGVPRLRPRASFSEWQETVRGTCSPWSAEDISVAGSMRETLSDIVITAYYFRQSFESPATARHRLAHQTNPNPVALADDSGMIVFQNPAAMKDPLLGNLHSLDQLVNVLNLQSGSVTNALHALVHDQEEIRLDLSTDPEQERWLEASRLTEDGRLIGYSIRIL